MSARIFTILLAASVAFTLWFDLARMESYASIRRFNRGVAHYRLGEFNAALEDFTVNATNHEPLRHHQILYNQGNCLVRLAEKNATSNSAAAEQFYRTALDRYRAALQLLPGDRETLTNQTAVTAAVAALVTDRMKQRKKTKKPSTTQPASSSDNTASREKRQDKEQSKTTGKSGQATLDNQEVSGNRRKAMGLEQAQRLLNEKRGQEALPSAVKSHLGGPAATQPAKDW